MSSSDASVPAQHRSHSGHHVVPKPRSARALAVVIAVVIGLPLAVAAITGALQIPRNDDWAFLRIAFHFADTGHFQLVGWNDMMLLGQIVLVYPIVKLAGHSIVALHLFAAVIAVAGLIATYLVARRFLSERRSLLVVLLTGLFPGFGLSATTFMTDAPAYAAQLGCVALGFVAFGSTRRRELWLDLALLVGLVGFTIREFSIAAPLAVIVGMFFVERHESETAWIRAVIRATAVATIAVALFRLRHALPGDTLGGLGIHLDQRELQHFTQAFVTFAIGLLPAVVWRVRQQTERTLMNFAAFAVVPLSLYVMTRSAGDATCCTSASSSLFVGNLLTEHGAMGNETLMGTRPAMFPGALWFVIMGAALAAGCLLAGLLWERGRLLVAQRGGRVRDLAQDPYRAALAAFGLLSLAGVVARGLIDGYLFDRYLWTLVPIGAIWLLAGESPAPRKTVRLTALAVALLVVVFVGDVTMSASFDAARWRAGRVGVASGVVATDVDAGFEWVGFHYAGVAGPSSVRRSQVTPPGYMFYFPRSGDCIMVSASALPPPDNVQVGKVAYRGTFLLGSNELFVYRNQPACELAT